MKRKTTSILLLLALLTSTLAGCGTAQEETTAAETTPAETVVETEAETEPPFPELEARDFEGHTFTMLNYDIHWNHMQLLSEGETGEPINDAIFRRNVAIEEGLNIVLGEAMGDAGTLKNAIVAGDAAYDIAFINGQSISSLLGSQKSRLLYDFRTEIPHIRLDAPWWSRSVNESISIGGIQYFTANDIHLSYFDSVMPLFMNLQMIEEFGLADPYELVRNGSWTMDIMGEMMQTVTSDLNGDGEYTLQDDRFGFFGMSEEYVSMAVGSGALIIKKDESDLPYCAFGEERFIDSFVKSVQILNDGYVFANYRLPHYDINGLANPFEVFVSGRCLFSSDVLFHVSNWFRDMEDNYGILPRPKYDEAQETYYNLCHPSGAFLCVPTTSDPDRTGYIMEALAQKSKELVIPAYYDTVLCGKLMRDEASIEMLDIVLDTRVSDLGAMLSPSGIYMQFANMGIKGDTNIVSVYESKQSAIETTLAKLVPTAE